MSELQHLSYSSINAYLSCPRLWKFRYIEKLPTFGSPNLFFGSVWHNAIEEYISVSATGTDALVDMYKKRWNFQLEREGEKMNWGGDNGEQETFDQGFRWITGEIDVEATGIKGGASMAAFLDTIKPLARKSPGEKEKPLHVEDFVTLNVPGVSIPIIGYIDVITEDGIPTDFKTSSKSWSEKKALEEMQPLFYLAALSQAGVCVPGRQFRHIIFVKNKTPKVQSITTTHNMAKLLWLYRVIEDVWKAIEVEAFPVNPTGWQCSPRFCDYWGSCRGKFDGV